MKAVTFHEYGPPEVLRYEDVPDPVIGLGDVLVRIRAAAIGHVDLDSRAGTSRHPLKFPHILGREMAGEVWEVGTDVQDVRRGDRVLVRSVLPCGRCEDCDAGRDNLCGKGQVLGVHRPGGYAEFVAAPATSLIPIPESLDFVQAAAVPSAFGTAWHMMVTLSGARPGEWVLVPSASGGVGSACVQVAKHLGCTVIATASDEAKAAGVRDLGADHVLQYPQVDVPREVLRLTGGRGVDVVLELVGGTNIGADLACLAHRGRLVVGGAHAGEIVPVDFIAVLRNEAQILGARRSTRAELDAVVALAGEGKLTPVIHTVLPLSRAAEAHRLMESRVNFGKILLTP
jgi:NADPH:quinone reductase-like Zn-dependent oxidoreductase